MCSAAEGTAVVVEDKWGAPVDPQKVEDALKQNPDAKIVAFVHAETSTGALSDAKLLCEIAHRHNCLTIVDTVTSLGGSPLKVDEWKIDAIYSGSQKCLSCPPGLVADQFFGTRGGTGQEPQGKSAKLVHGLESAAGILGNHPHLSPYRPHQRALCVA